MGTLETFTFKSRGFNVIFRDTSWKYYPSRYSTRDSNEAVTNHVVVKPPEEPRERATERKLRTSKDRSNHILKWH